MYVTPRNCVYRVYLRQLNPRVNKNQLNTVGGVICGLSYCNHRDHITMGLSVYHTVVLQ